MNEEIKEKAIFKIGLSRALILLLKQYPDFIIDHRKLFLKYCKILGVKIPKKWLKEYEKNTYQKRK